ncbi:MAG: hypothetical protein JWO41_917 [Candidatus Saccharibacteria bacterium]|nr:hypothetical protein [Candidatus Saccharibacteria bacterium]
MKWGFLPAISLLLAAMPSSTNYGLHNYGFGSGGTSSSTSSSYKLNATTGEVSNTQSTSATYQSRPGNQNEQQSNVPPAPTFTNPSNYYDKLKFVISTGNNASTAKFAVAISSDNFVTTLYVHPDGTASSTLSLTDRQTYVAWGGASGQLVTGLSSTTTYKMKVNAMQGNFTETEFGPTASAATVAPSISFSIFTDTQPTAPFTTSFPNLLPATVVSTNDKLWFNLTTNADAGAIIYISSQFAGLKSNNNGNTIVSATADLTSASSGYGAQNQSVTQTSGGPFSMVAPFNGAGQNVGALTTSLQPIFSSSLPVTAGSGSLLIKAKAASTTPSSNDYGDKITLTSAAVF